MYGTRHTWKTFLLHKFSFFQHTHIFMNMYEIIPPYSYIIQLCKKYFSTNILLQKDTKMCTRIHTYMPQTLNDIKIFWILNFKNKKSSQRIRKRLYIVVLKNLTRLRNSFLEKCSLNIIVGLVRKMNWNTLNVVIKPKRMLTLRIMEPMSIDKIK